MSVFCVVCVSASTAFDISAARRGDETAIESLTLDDMDLYTTLSKKIRKQDVYSLVDSYFMPYGVECNHYSVLGEITETKKVKNRLTKMQSARIIQTISSAIEARSLSVLLPETVRSSEGRGKGIFAETVVSRTGITSWDAVEQAADSYT